MPKAPPSYLSKLKRLDKGMLESLRGLVHAKPAITATDPVEYVNLHKNVRDREIAGLVASSLAYGKVSQIRRDCETALGIMGPPRAYVDAGDRRRFERDFRGFKHRFTTGDEMAALLAGVKAAIDNYGSLEKCFVSGLQEDDPTIVGALGLFVSTLTKFFDGGESYLLPHPSKGSACKRLCLYLAWMTRKDEVSPGGWENVPASKLLIPLDTHMHQIALAAGLTRRRQANLTTTLEVTAAFAKICPEDPVRYDFALTRLGIAGHELPETRG